ncbi:hypothetical protein [Streptomyces sp. NBC_01255]|uniref:hypothetical protein n=1 Tax=Streptomyces sp. NBC_01255 TaxID=2903798 RepID=UPI003FCE2F63
MDATARRTTGGTHKCDGANGSAHASKVPTPVGGCQFEIENGDRVAFTWTSF